MTESKGYKTKQREVILKVLTNNAERHLTAEDIVFELRENGDVVGKTTVYRYLDKLVSEGLVRKYSFEEGTSACYQYSGGNVECAEHFHLKCVVCNQLFHVECDYLNELADHVFQHHRFKIDNSKTVLYGVCEECSQK